MSRTRLGLGSRGVVLFAGTAGKGKDSADDDNGNDSSRPSSPGSAMGPPAPRGGVGGGEAAAPMTAEESFPHERRFVLMCALQTIDPASLDSSLGFRLFLDRLSPGLAAWKRKGSPSSAAKRASGILWDLCAGVRRGVVAALTAQSESCRRLGWTGPFVALQVDSTGTAGSAGTGGGEHGGSGDGEEVCTASVSFVPEDFGGLVRLAIGARCFHGREESHEAKEAWIREVQLYGMCELFCCLFFLCCPWTVCARVSSSVDGGFDCCNQGVPPGWVQLMRRGLSVRSDVSTRTSRWRATVWLGRLEVDARKSLATATPAAVFSFRRLSCCLVFWRVPLPVILGRVQHRRVTRLAR